MVHSVLQSVTRSDIRLLPYPHLVIRNCLPAIYYARLEREYPSDETILGLSGARNRVAPNSRIDLSAYRALGSGAPVSTEWREFIRYHVSADFFRELVALLGPEIKRTYPTLESRIGGPLDQCATGVRFDPLLDHGRVSLDCQIGINTPSSMKSSVRRVHTDATEELFAMLLYFRRPEDKSRGGDLEIYKWKSHTGRRFIGEAVAESDAELVDSIRYEPNTLVAFINSGISLHAVSEREPSNVSRRLVNIIGRVYRSVPEGLFQKPQKSLLGRLKHQVPTFVKTRILR